MKKMIKRILSGLICVALVLSFVPALEKNVHAETGYDRGYTGSMPGDGKIYAHGLDVSAWQESGLNFQNFANAGYDYVILRCGTSYGKDRCFEEYYASAKAAGLDVGCYFYSYALSGAEAQAEAYDVLSWIEGKVFEYPVYFDFEDDTQMSLSYTLSAQICRGFMDVLKDNGYLAGIYSYSWLLSRDWITTSGIRDTYEAWVAHVYSDAANTGITSGEYNIYKDRYCSVYGMHQYSFTTYVNGVGPFDANVCYKDYPAIVKQYGFNGYNEDKEKPVISNVSYSNVSAAGYTVTCKVTDNYGVKSVSFPTWTVNNGQDDLAEQFMTTQVGTKNGDTYTFNVKASDHNNEGGSYVTHIYATDRAGNVACLELNAVEVRNDNQNPVISDVVFSDVSAAGYTISCKVTDDWGVSSVAFPTWTVNNGQDDLPEQFMTTQLGTKKGNIYTFRVNASDHNNEAGSYATHIYATDCAGNTVSLALNPVEVRNDTQNPVISDVAISNVTAAGYTVTCKVTDDWGVNSVAFPTWTVQNGQDDLAEHFMTTQVGTRNGNTFTFHVKASDHNNETGHYLTHIYAKDCAGNVVSLVLNTVDVKDPAPETTLGQITLISTSEYTNDNGLLVNVKASTAIDALLGQFENEDLEVVDCNGNVISGSSIVGTGSTINLYIDGALVDTVTVVILGDVDGNGNVDTTDYMRVKSAFLGSFTLNDAQHRAADVDGSGVIDTTDYMRIKSHFLGTYDLYE